MAKYETEKPGKITLHYSGLITIQASCRETGRETKTQVAVDYNAGDIEPGRKRLTQKLLKEAISHGKEVPVV